MFSICSPKVSLYFTITAEAKNIVRYTEDVLVNIGFHIEIPLDSVRLPLVQIFLTVRTRPTPDQPRGMRVKG